MTKLLIRVAGTLLVAAGAFAILWSPVREKRLDDRVRGFLLEVQAGLQDYHVDEELYPTRPMRGKALIALLVEGEFLTAGIVNPWSGVRYLESADEDDRLRYRTNEVAETYELTALRPRSDTEHYRLDSVENQSLEE